ncbi:MAG TPA: hypothetical protein VFV78_13750 [Vicinamibacterales bacterium]|nr:hypothetical protein [Vicinamibacterales bacterium]
MISRIRRAMLAAVVGALAAALSLVAAYIIHPGLVFEMDRPLPSFIQGIYGQEADAQGTYSWTSAHVSAEFPGLDRQVGWACTIRFRGPRPAGEPTPTLDVRVDGRPAAHVTATPEYQDLGVMLPPQANATGASILMDIAPAFTPGTADTRVLGVQLDRFLCRPASSIVRPPSDTLSQATLAAAIFSAGLALLGLSLSSAMFAAAAIGLGQTLMMVMGSGMYGDYPARLPWLALGVVGPAFLVARVIERWRHEPLSSTARFVVACCAAVLFLKLAGLYHPAKPVIDADFNAHRLEWVLAGRFFFTQPLPNGVAMPYAIGFYIFSAPWGWLFGATKAVVWTVAASMDVVAGALLYPVILKAWGDRRAAAAAAVFFQLVPAPFVTLGNANLPNMFGQAMALMAMLAAVAWRLDARRFPRLAGFTILAAWALCAHVSTVTIFTATIGVLIVLYFWRGDPDRRRAAGAMALGVAAALAFAWFAYYQHWLDVFRSAFSLMFRPPTPEEAAAAAVVKGNMTLAQRVADLATQAVNAAGWPLLILSAIGIWSLVRRRERGRLESALMAWAIVWIVFSASTVFARVDQAYVRYSAEFLGRINLATVPLIAILAARGAASGWEAETPAGLRRPLQTVAAVLCVWALLVAMWAWMGWFTR